MNNKKIIGLLLLAIVAVSAQAQDSYIKERWNAKLGYSNSFFTEIEYQARLDSYTSSKPMALFDVGYGISKHFEVGGTLGFSPYIRSEYDGRITKQDNHLYLFGAQANYHILPHWVESDDFRLDLYLSGKAGGYIDQNLVFNQTDFNGYYGIYAGSAFYLKKHLGLFAEVGYGNFTNLRYGLTWKW